MSIQAIALFCDDIREERAGSTTLVGIMQDNFELQNIPSALSRLAIYVRINLEVSEKPRPLSVLLEFPDGNRHTLGEFSKELVKKSQAEAKLANNTLAGLIANVVAPQFPVPQIGRVTVQLKDGNQLRIIGGLNFVLPASS